MGTLTDQIESYLKQMLAGSGEGLIEIQRSWLAQMFSCAPSQINYVLTTRFSIEQGYLVESRRGGGGYVRIVRLPINVHNEEQLRKLLEITLGESLSQQAGEGVIQRLFEEGHLTDRESQIMRAAIRRETLALDLPHRDLIRANLLRAMILALWQGMDS
ncbi:MAG: CtsR family transcriptional regulator [Bacillota bacterium]